MPNINVTLFFIPLFLVGFLLVLNYMHKKVWNILQERYLCVSKDFRGEKITIRNLAIDGLNFQNVVKMRISNSGLYMRIIAPFNLLSKPIMIPWTEIVEVQEKKMIFGTYKRLVIGKPFASTIDIPTADYLKLSRYIDQNRTEKSKLSM